MQGELLLKTVMNYYGVLDIDIWKPKASSYICSALATESSRYTDNLGFEFPVVYSLPMTLAYTSEHYNDDLLQYAADNYYNSNFMSSEQPPEISITMQQTGFNETTVSGIPGWVNNPLDLY
jgi:hypothetical protein